MIGGLIFINLLKLVKAVFVGAVFIEFETGKFKLFQTLDLYFGCAI